MPKRATTASKKSRKSDTQPPFKFTELPPELRNAVYIQACSEHPSAFLSAGTRGHLASPLGLLGASRQLRRECLPILSFSVPEIIARVKDLDFGPVITFFNRCADIDLQTLPSAVQESDDEGRKLTIELEFTENFHYFIDRLQRWLNRFARPAKRGTAVRVEYRIVSESIDHMDRFKGIVHKMQDRYEDKRQVDEVKRMFRESKRAIAAWVTAKPFGIRFRVDNMWYDEYGYPGR